MANELFQWLLSLPATFASFGSWLVNPISDTLPIAPLAIFGVGTISMLIGFKAVRLIVGG